MKYTAQQTTLFRVTGINPPAGQCGNAVCELSVSLADNVLVGVTLLGVVTLVTLAYIRTATEACRDEHQRVMDEYDGFSEFANRVKAIDPVSPGRQEVNGATHPAQQHQTIKSTNSVDITVRQVLSIYEDTVISTPHYRDEYDETVTESMAAELGKDIMTSLATNQTLSPSIKSTLISRSQSAAAARESLASAIETELDELSDADVQLTEINRSRSRLMEHLAEVNGNEADAGIDAWHRINDLENEIEEVATKRQQSIRDPPMTPNSAVDADDQSFYEYLYADCEEFTHPVLRQAADLTTSLRDDRDQIVDRIAGHEHTIE